MTYSRYSLMSSSTSVTFACSSFTAQSVKTLVAAAPSAAPRVQRTTPRPESAMKTARRSADMTKAEAQQAPSSFSSRVQTVPAPGPGSAGSGTQRLASFVASSCTRTWRRSPVTWHMAVRPSGPQAPAPLWPTTSSSPPVLPRSV